MHHAAKPYYLRGLVGNWIEKFPPVGEISANAVKMHLILQIAPANFLGPEL
jgi:hypothetical protein